MRRWQGKNLEEFEFAHFATRNWQHYMYFVEDEQKDVHTLALHLLTKPQLYRRWWTLHEREFENCLPQPQPLYYACLAGLKLVAQALIQDGAEVNGQGGLYGSALQAALSRGNTDMVKILLEKGGRCQCASVALW